MSSSLAIAAVTAVLRDLLVNGIIDHDLPATLGDVKVSALSPDRIPIGDQEQSQLNIFLYQVTPNLGWRNVGLPSRNGDGARLTNPPLALDLHYLITAYGAKDFHAEILLGNAMQWLHETPVLARAAIRRALDPTPVSGGGNLPPTMQNLIESELAEQVEQIKLTPQTMNAEEISRIWSALQARYRPSAAYLASVVLIESQAPVRAPLPVLTRGGADPITSRERGVFIQPNLQTPFPTIESIKPPNQQPSARLNEIVTVKGVHLDGESGDTVVALLSHPRLQDAAQVAPLGGGSASQLQIRIPDDPENFPAGLYALSVGFIKAGKLYRTTNHIGLALAPNNPSITNPAPILRDANGSVTLIVNCAPKIWRGQRASLILGSREAMAEFFGDSQTDTVTFKFQAMDAGDYLTRLRVDGVESLLIQYDQTPPAFDPTQRVTLA